MTDTPQRYALKFNGGQVDFFPDDEGAWVRHRDIAPLIESWKKDEAIWKEAEARYTKALAEVARLRGLTATGLTPICVCVGYSSPDRVTCLNCGRPFR